MCVATESLHHSGLLQSTMSTSFEIPSYTRAHLHSPLIQTPLYTHAHLHSPPTQTPLLTILILILAIWKKNIVWNMVRQLQWPPIYFLHSNIRTLGFSSCGQAFRSPFGSNRAQEHLLGLHLSDISHLGTILLKDMLLYFPGKYKIVFQVCGDSSFHKLLATKAWTAKFCPNFPP